MTIKLFMRTAQIACAVDKYKSYERSILVAYSYQTMNISADTHQRVRRSVSFLRQEWMNAVTRLKRQNPLLLIQLYPSTNEEASCEKDQETKKLGD